MKRAFAGVLVASVVALGARQGLAHDRGERGSPDARVAEQTSDFWRAVREPGYRRSQVLVRHGVERLTHAIRAFIRQPHLPHLGRAHVESALVRLHLAHARAPEDPEALYLLTMARVMWRSATDASRLTAEDQETLELLEKLRALDPEYEAARVAFELGILYTRAHDFPRAASEYQRCLHRILLPTEEPLPFRTAEDLLADRLFGPIAAPTVHYNMGDVTMALGDLPTAITHYRRAVDQGRRSGHEFRTVLLASWGLAAALDRFGEHGAALEHAREAVRLDDEPMAVLHLSSVFFEPRYEIHYYEALGHTVIGTDTSGTMVPPDHDEWRLQALEDAVQSWERFLAEGGDESPWAELARKHLGEARRRVEEASGRR